MKKINGFLPLLVLLLTFPDLWAQAPSGYYDAAVGKNKKDLLVALKGIVGSHKNVGYDGLWEVYKTSDVRADGYVWDMYSTANFTPGQKQCGNYSKVGDCYNREHSFPKSWFNDASPMVSDGFHIYPTDGKVNGQRSNFPYGECANGTSVASNGNIKALGKLGTSTFSGYTGTVFEPIDDYKGDFARTYFYMAAAYQDKIKGWGSPMLSNNDYPCFSTWAINLLLKWHRQDPVSKKETDRNNAVETFQKNRNPFIDHPELAEYIWGTKQDGGWTPGGSVDPVLSNPVNGSTIDMGITSIVKPLSYTIDVNGVGLNEDVNVSITNSNGFTLSNTVLSKDAICSAGGAKEIVTFTNSTSGEYTATLKLSNSEVETSVTLKAMSVDGIPALQASDIEMDSFTANWINVANTGNYSLSVFNEDGTTLVSGYPVSVAASAGSYKVTGLNYSSTYHYQLADGTLKSNVITVKTADPEQVLSLIYPEGGMTFNAEPKQPSEPVEVEVYTEYITKPITASVTGAFEISFDKTNWSQSLTVNPDGENIYVRMKASDAEGSFTGVLGVETEDFDGQEVDLKGIVAYPRTFFEDFESFEVGGYYTGEKQGTACKWNMTDVGVWGTKDDRYNDERSGRFGKTGKGSIVMAENKIKGAGTLSFLAGTFGSDAESVVSVSYSIDGGATWTKIADAKVSEPKLKEFNYSVSVKEPIRFSFVETSGKRINIDDIAISDYVASVSNVENDKWDAYGVNGGIVVESDGTESVSVYTVDAKTAFEGLPSAGKYTISLPAGIYIVASGDNNGKKVVVK